MNSLKVEKKNVNSIYSVISGFCAGRAIQKLWALPIITAVFYLAGTRLFFDTGEKAFYLYDMQENTFQRFYNTQVEIYRDLLKKLEIGVIGLGALIAILFILFVACLNILPRIPLC